MANISISQMNTRAEANLSDLHEVAYADSNSQTGYASGKMTMEVMANAIVNNFAYQSLGNKTVKGAIEDAEVTVDSELDDTSLNPIANKPVAEAIADIVGDISDIDSNIEGSKQLTTTGNVITVSDSAATYLEELEVEVEPIQDLHGYDYPWVGGAGKNILPMTISNIKSTNTAGTWNGNTYNYRNVKFELLTDDANNVTGIKVNSTGASAVVEFSVSSFTDTNYNDNLAIGEYIVSGERVLINKIPQGGNYSNTTFSVTSDNKVGSCYIYVPATQQMDNVIIYPMIRLATVTDATFTPYSNICPISGYDSAEYTRTGVNIWDEQWEVGGISDVTGENVTATDRMRSKNYISVFPKTYYFIQDTVNSRLFYYDKNKTLISTSYVNNSPRVFTTPINCYYLRFFSVGTTYNNDISINYPSTITTYQPYQGQSVTLTFDNTVYSGTVDWCTGVVTVDKAMVDLGSLTWDANLSLNIFYAYVNGLKQPTTEAQRNQGITSSNYYASTTIVIDATMPNGTMLKNNSSIYIKDVSYNSVANFKTAMDGVQLLYELATPQTIQLTPQQLQMLKGYNTVTTDANGGMTIKYQPDNVVGEIKAYASRLYDDILDRLEALSE